MILRKLTINNKTMAHLLQLLFLFFIPTIVFSQEKVLDKAYLKCHYKYSYLKDTLDIATYDDLLILQIGQNVSKSYSYYSFQADSLSKTENGKKVWKEIFNKSLNEWKVHRDRNKWLNSFPHYRSTTIVHKNYPEGKMTVTDAVSNERVRYIDSLDIQDWNIIDSVKSVLGYMCQKAECNFRGRNWTAWFSPDIPVSDGPWKFEGLPGLIMEIYDRGSQYHFSLVGIKRVNDEPILFRKQPLKNSKYTILDRKEFLKIKMNRLTHSSSFMEAEDGISFGKDKPVYRDLIERDYR